MSKLESTSTLIAQSLAITPPPYVEAVLTVFNSSGPQPRTANGGVIDEKTVEDRELEGTSLTHHCNADVAIE
jgi:hypothetical protein